MSLTAISTKLDRQRVLTAEFFHGDRVHIDGDVSIVATVTAILWRSTVTQLEVSWVHCGDIKTFWLEEWRLTKADAA
jgi:hypothetical protein